MKDLFFIISDQLHDVINLCGEDPSLYSFERENKCLFNIRKECELVETIDLREQCRHHIIKGDERWILYLISIICPDPENIPFPDSESEPCPEPCKPEPCKPESCEPCVSYNPCDSYEPACCTLVRNCPYYCPDFAPSSYNAIPISTKYGEDLCSEKKGSVKICRKKLDQLLEIIRLENLARLSNRHCY